MSDSGQRGSDDPTVRERRSEAPKVASITDSEAPETVRMDGAPPPLEPVWNGETHQRGALLGRYVILSLLGKGGMGEVYTAYDPALDRRIALKVIKPYGDEGSQSSARGMLLAEAQALAKLAHPNVVHVYDAGTIEGDVYMAMEYVEGETLNRWLRREHTPAEIIEVFLAAGSGLEAAHAAHIVHRDFKPENVILGKDGRVRVIDFGIALVRKQSASAAAAEGLVGTPAFMAPEQFKGGEVGPAADQFSFAVALYWALWRQHAFPGDSDAALKFNVLDGNMNMPPVGGPVPPRVREAIIRALAREPAARHPSLTEFLAALEPPPRRSPVPYVIAGGVALAAAAVVTVLALTRSSGPEPCTGFDRELEPVWGAARKAIVQKQVKPDAWPAIERTFDAYTVDWVSNKVAACRATSVTREQTPAVMERRMSCLDTRRRELDAAVAIVAAGGTASMHAIEIGSGLRSPSSCANLSTLAPMPRAAPADVQSVETGLATARAERLAGEFPEARKAATIVLADAVRIAWGSAIARALVERGLSEMADGDPNAARETLFEAIRHGEESNDSASTAAAWIGLINVEAAGLRAPTEALRWAKHAEVALSKAGADQEQQGQLLHNIAAALRLLDRNTEALDNETRALALFEHAFGVTHVRVANQRGSVATSLRNVGKLDEAVREGEAALKLLEQDVGPEHPYVATVLNSLALTYDEHGDLEAARAALERALKISERELGPNHIRNANPLMNLVSLERRAGHPDKAEALWRRAYDIRLANLGANHPDVTRALHGKLLDLVNRGLDTEARALVDDVVSRQRLRTDPLELASALALRCELERRANKLEAAANTCNEAIAATAKNPDANRALYLYAYAARVAAQRKKVDEATRLLATAQTALTGATHDLAVARGFVGWAAAYVALAAGHHDEAVAAAHAARDSLLSHGKNFIYVVADLERIQ